MTDTIKTEVSRNSDDTAPNEPDPMALFTAQLAFIKTKPDYKAAWHRKQKSKGAINGD